MGSKAPVKPTAEQQAQSPVLPPSPPLPRETSDSYQQRTKAMSDTLTLQSLNAHCGKVLHWHGPEQDVSAVAAEFGIPKERIHKTTEVKFHIHNLTDAERRRLESLTLGNTKGVLRHA